MTDIRYVCLSDLHFGAQNSILSALVKDDVTVDPSTPSAVLESLVAVLRHLIAANADQGRKPTLILNGDILELALANDNVALMVLERFLDRVFPPDGNGLFDDTVMYLPGNHDHHIWETARERQYANLLATLTPDESLPIPWHATRMYAEGDPRPVPAELLNSLVARRPHQAGVNFRISYPNLGLLSDDGQTLVVFHHGHFIESIYKLMSTLKDIIFPGRAKAVDSWDIEAENFAWIDFFWSTLGRSGDVGAHVGLVYDMLQSDAAIEHLAGNVAFSVAARSPGPAVRRWITRAILDKGLKTVLTRVARSERKTPIAPLSADAQKGLLAYLAGPLLRQMVAEAHGRPLPTQVKFIFGHTHKPFIGTRTVPGYGKPIRVFNTGGWVVDTLQVEPLHGANLALVDENMEVACLRLYNQASDPTAYQVHLDDGLPEEQGPFYQRLAELIDAGSTPWTTFSTDVAALVAERSKALAKIIADAGQPR